MMIATSNAVNLTDGDWMGWWQERATIAYGPYTVIGIMQENPVSSSFRPLSPARCGFSSLNANPAKVFMGDTGYWLWVGDWQRWR